MREPKEYVWILPRFHPLIQYRRTPTSKLKRVLDLNRFGDSGPLPPINLHLKTLDIPLSQHIGKPTVAIVAVGDQVEASQKIATAGKDLGAEIHSPATGKVLSIGVLE